MTIADNIATVHATIAAACTRAARPVADVRLIAVSKTQSAQTIAAAMAAGLREFGENRIEESEDKLPLVTGDGLIWHMIGNIQSRKAKRVPLLFQMVHSVDDVELARKLSSVASAQPLGVLVQINVSGEASKSGLPAHDWASNAATHAAIVAALRTISALPNLRLDGLMTMAPIVDNAEQTRPVFASLRQLRDALTQDLGVPLPHLSMGMTDDYPIAIEEGATLVRVGRAIFGARG
jgi:PLP dependent protein